MTESAEKKVSAGDARRFVRSNLAPVAAALVGQPGMGDLDKAQRLTAVASWLQNMTNMLNSAASIYAAGTKDTALVTVPQFIMPELPVSAVITVPDTVPADWQAPEEEGKSQD